MELALATPNELHARLVNNANEAVLLAALIGTQLAAIREGLEHGEWEPWVEQNCAFTVRTARNYLDAAARAQTAILENGNAFRFESNDTATVGERVREALLTLIEWGGDSIVRQHMIEAIRKPRPALPPPAPPKAPRAPRPPAPPVKIASRYAAKVRTAPEEVRDALFHELLPDFRRWLEAHTTA